MATISAFRAALAAPIEHFRTMTNIVWSGAVPILRSCSFAESEAMIDDKSYRILMPLTPQALHPIEQITPLKLHLLTSLIPPLTILRNEMCVGDEGEQPRYCDILLEPICEGVPFGDALSHAATDSDYATMLLSALDNLKEALDRAEISLNNMREENLVLDKNDDLRPVRCYYMTKGAGGDEVAFATIRTKIVALIGNSDYHHATASAYDSTTNTLTAYLNHQPMSEGLIAVKSKRGWGFIDSDGKEVIAPHYDWVGTFCEGRTEVKIGDKMGLIDKQGEYIIPLAYDIVDYNHTTGNSAVRCGNEWCLFDYSGRQITRPDKSRPTFQDKQ